MRAANSVGNSGVSNEATADIDCPIGAVRNLRVTAGNMVLAVSWSAPTEGVNLVDSYSVQYRLSSEATFAEWPHSGTGTTATITGVSNGAVYTIRVAGKTAQGGIGPYAEMMAQPLAPTPTPRPTSTPIPTSTPTPTPIPEARSGREAESSRNAPTFTEGYYTERFVLISAQSGSPVGEPLRVVDPNGSDFTFSVPPIGDDYSLFSVDERTGQLRLRSPLTQQDQQEFLVWVRVVDATGEDDLVGVTVITGSQLPPTPTPRPTATPTPLPTSTPTANAIAHGHGHGHRGSVADTASYANPDTNAANTNTNAGAIDACNRGDSATNGNAAHIGPNIATTSNTGAGARRRTIRSGWLDMATDVAARDPRGIRWPPHPANAASQAAVIGRRTERLTRSRRDGCPSRRVSLALSPTRGKRLSPNHPYARGDD